MKELFDDEVSGVKKQDAAAISWEDLPEDGYFGMYTHFSIHETMLKVYTCMSDRIFMFITN